MSEPGAPSLRTQVEAVTARLREQGALDDAGEAALVRHFQDRRGQLEAELRDLFAEFGQRVESEGQTAAEQWLAEASAALGRRDRDALLGALSQAGLPSNVAAR